MNQDSIYIVGSGTSLKDFNFNSLADKDVIAVNKSIFYLPLAKYFVTMDYSFLTKIREKYKEFTEHKASKIFIVNFTKPYLQDVNGAIVDTRRNLIYHLRDFHTIIKSHKTDSFGLDFKDFRNGDNSGYCALQFALLLNYKNIYLLGFDLQCQKQTHFHDGYQHQNTTLFSKNLELYYNYFQSGLKYIQEIKPNINIYNCSKKSKLAHCLPYFDLTTIC